MPIPPPPSSEAQTTDVCAVLTFVTGLLSVIIMPIIFGPIAFILSFVSYYRLKENPQLKGAGLRLAGAIMSIIALLQLLYLFTSSPGY